MKLPQDATIDPEKITHYLLRPRDEDDKSAFLGQVGYTQSQAEQLLTDLRRQIQPLDAECLGTLLYGTKYRIRGVLRGPNGRELRIVSIWATIEKTGFTKFITLYPDNL